MRLPGVLAGDRGGGERRTSVSDFVRIRPDESDPGVRLRLERGAGKVPPPGGRR